MSSAEERQVKAQEAIAGYLKGLVPVLTAINANLAEFGKIVKTASETKIVRVKTTEQLAKEAALHPERGV